VSSQAAKEPAATGRVPNRLPFWRSGIFIILSLLLGTHADAAPVEASASYVVNLAGINVASVTIRFSDDGARYSIDIGANVTGAGTLVAKGTASAGVQGLSRNGMLMASAFNLETRANGEVFKVDVDYARGDATGFQVQPPVLNNIGRVAVERKHMRGVGDPIASFILSGSKLEPQLCERRLKVFTGMERYDIAMNFAAHDTATSPRTGYQGPVVLCRLRYLPISGHFAQSEMTNYLAQSEKMLIWYAPMKDSGYFIPYRILMGTSVGDLSMVLTALR